MKSSFNSFQILLNGSHIKTENKNLQDVFNKFDFRFYEINVATLISQISNDSKIIIIDECQEENGNQYFIICYDYHLIIVQNLDMNDLFLSEKDNSKIYFLKPISIRTKKQNVDPLFLYEIDNFSFVFKINSNFQIRTFWNQIVKCMSGFLIKQSYLKSIQKYNSDHKSILNNTKQKKIDLKKGEFIKLRELGKGSLGSVDLIYHIIKGELFALKIPNESTGKYRELIEREEANYSKISFPYIVYYYGCTEIDQKKCLIIEYIEGQTLDKYDLKKLSFNEKINIIFELMHTIQYLHSQKYICRDLHLNNIIINNNKDSIFIDFDRVIQIEEQKTLDFYQIKLPELESGELLTYKSDILLLGFIIYYILYEKIPTRKLQQTNEHISIFYDLSSISDDSKDKKIFDLCFRIEPKERFSIEEMICQFYEYILSNLNSEEDKKQFLDKHFELSSSLSEFFCSHDINKTKENYENSNTFNNSKVKEYFDIYTKQKKSEAHYILGNFYEKGHGVKQNYAKAKEYYEKSAEQNNSNAFINLGYLYEKGLGVKQNYAKAKEYYEMSAKQNNSEAFNMLGNLYLNGFGVKQDFSKAIKYYKKSAKQNNSYAFINLGYLYEKGLGISRDYSKAKEYYEISTKLNNSYAFIYLGYIYEKGLGVKQDYSKAKEYYEKSANIGNYVAFKKLGDMYFKGEGVEQNYIKAKEYYELSSETNNLDALFNLGNIYYNGYGVEKNYIKAQKYYELSAKQNNPKALFFLGVFYSTNEICNQNIQKAIENYQKCIEIENGYVNIYYNKQKDFKIVFRTNNYRHRARNDLGLIYLFDLKGQIEKGIENIKESAFAEYPFGQNNFALLNQFYLNKIGNAEYLYRRSAKHHFALAEYNLGYLKEKNGEEEKSIEHYIKASEYEDEPLMFRDIEHNDIQLTISKAFIICFTNLKLFNYFYLKKDFAESKKYFVKSLAKLKYTENDISYQFELPFDYKDVKNSFSYLKAFILNFPLFNLSNQKYLITTLDKLNIGISKNEKESNKCEYRIVENKKIRKIEKEILLKENISNEKNFSELENAFEANNLGREDNENRNEEKIIFTNTKEFIDFIFENKNKNYKTYFYEDIKEIINCMHEILYTSPYRILFGRIIIKKRKNCIEESCLKYQKEINELFYEGLDMEEFH